MLSKLLFLQPGELNRLTPFFAMYMVLSSGFALADVMSQSLVVQRVGVQALPSYYAAIAIGNLLVVSLYIIYAHRMSGVFVFQSILVGCMVAYLFAYLGLRYLGRYDSFYGTLFVSRDIAFTLVLMHFGTYLQDYFTRDELTRVLTIVYAGGRVGSILGGIMVSWLTDIIGLRNLALVFVGLMVGCFWILMLIHWFSQHAESADDNMSDTGAIPKDILEKMRAERQRALEAMAAAQATQQPQRTPSGRFIFVPQQPEPSLVPTTPDLEKQAQSSVGGFLNFVWKSPLLYWITITAILFMVCKWLLNFQYNTFFETYFDTRGAENGGKDAASMANFLGYYTQVASALSLIIQLFVVNRLIAWVGVRGVFFVYGLLVAVSIGLNVVTASLGSMTVVIAVFARLVENELRLGLRNPAMQIITNRFSKASRLRVRAWSMGVLTPVGTLAASGVLFGLAALNSVFWGGVIAAGLGLLYLLTTIALCRTFRDKKKPKQGPGNREQGTGTRETSTKSQEQR